jgi:aminoglycoside phosphotransferase (APT) family kinase protein
MPPPRRDLELTQRQLCAWLRGKLPGARDVTITDLRGPSETGFSSDTLMFDLHWTAATGTHREPMVARFKPSGFTVFPTYDIARQFHVMRILGERTDVPVPRMRWLEEDAAPLGAPFYVMDRVDGRVPTDNPPYHLGGWLQDLTPDQRAALWWSGLDAMARVHQIDWCALGLAFLQQPASHATLLEQQLHEYDDYVSWGMERDRYPLLARAQAWLAAHRPVDEPVAICWGDSRLGNQIFNGTTCAAVIDWEMVRLGDPVQDLAWWITLDRCFSEGLGVARLAGLPDRAATIARWEALVGRPAQHFDYYEILALFKFTAIMARVSLQLMHYEYLPADSNMDSDNLASQTLRRALDAVGA